MCIIRTTTYHSGTEVWYADDASCAGSCSNLRKWWDCISTLGPKYGYFPKNTFGEENAKALFEGTHITTGESRNDFVVNAWAKEIETMADIANTQPHAVYSALRRLSLDLMQPLEDPITGRPPCSKIEREISTQPGIPMPTNSQSSFNASVTITTPMVNLRRH